MDADRQEWIEEESDRVLKLINRNYLWSSETWGGTWCAGCGMEVRPCFQQREVQLTYVNGRTVYHAAFNRYACDHSEFHDRCPGENPDWETELSVDEED